MKHPRWKPVSWLLVVVLFVFLAWFGGLLNRLFNPSADQPTEFELDATTERLLAKPLPALLPAPVDSLQIVHHFGFSLAYNAHHEQAAWVAYELTQERLLKPVTGRARHFYPDPNVSSATADVEDYRRSGYDRGHLAPAADMKWSKRAMQESFYFSNVSPQQESFNGGLWRELEEEVRAIARRHKRLLVITGPVLRPNLKRIGRQTKVSIPTAYYKVLLDTEPPDIEAVGYLVPAFQHQKSLQDFIVPVDSIEHVTGLNFLHQFQDATENALESHVYNAHWRTRMQ